MQYRDQAPHGLPELDARVVVRLLYTREIDMSDLIILTSEADYDNLYSTIGLSIKSEGPFTIQP